MPNFTPQQTEDRVYYLFGIITVYATNRQGLQSRLFPGVEAGLRCPQNVAGLSATCRMDANPTATKHRQEVR